MCTTRSFVEIQHPEESAVIRPAPGDPPAAGDRAVRPNEHDRVRPDERVDPSRTGGDILDRAAECEGTTCAAREVDPCEPTVDIAVLDGRDPRCAAGHRDAERVRRVAQHRRRNGPPRLRVDCTDAERPDEPEPSACGGEIDEIAAGTGDRRDRRGEQQHEERAHPTRYGGRLGSGPSERAPRGAL